MKGTFPGISVRFPKFQPFILCKRLLVFDVFPPNPGAFPGALFSVDITICIRRLRTAWNWLYLKQVWCLKKTYNRVTFSLSNSFGPYRVLFDQRQGYGPLRCRDAPENKPFQKIPFRNTGRSFRDKPDHSESRSFWSRRNGKGHPWIHRCQDPRPQGRWNFPWTVKNGLAERRDQVGKDFCIYL